MTPDPQPPAPGDDMPDESTDAPTEPLDTDERAELERLRAEVASLRAHTHSASTATPREPRRIGRRIVAGVLVVLCAFLTILGVVTRYIQNDIIDTDRYVATVTPLASDPAVQEQVITSVTAAIDQQLNLQTVVADALQKITELTPADRPRIDAAFVGLAPVLAGQATSYINSTVTDFVRSPISRPSGSTRTAAPRHGSWDW